MIGWTVVAVVMAVTIIAYIVWVVVSLRLPT